MRLNLGTQGGDTDLIVNKRNLKGPPTKNNSINGLDCEYKIKIDNKASAVVATGVVFYIIIVLPHTLG